MKPCCRTDCENPNVDSFGMLPFTEFYRNKNRPDGYTGQCKHCFKRYEQSEKGKAKNKKWNRTKKRQDCNSKYRVTEKNAECQERWRKKTKKTNPNRIKAHSAVQMAVKKGTLPQVHTLQCVYKGSNCQGQAQHYHHPNGYEPEHWLDVIPVCHDCHCEIHGKTRRRFD